MAITEALIKLVPDCNAMAVKAESGAHCPNFGDCITGPFPAAYAAHVSDGVTDVNSMT